MSRRLALIPCTLVAAVATAAGEPAVPAWREIPPDCWKGLTAEAPALGRRIAAAVASPARDVRPLTATTDTAQAPGLYEFRLTLRPSHVANAAAFQAGLRVRLDDRPCAVFPGHSFARVHQPETRTLQAVQRKAGPLMLVLEAFAAAGTAGRGEPDLELEPLLAPERSVYYMVDRIEFRPLSRSGRVESVETDRIRYPPGATLKGRAVVADVGGKGGKGILNVFLESGLNERTAVRSLPVVLTPDAQAVDLELRLPDEELGYALVAEYVSADGADRSEAAEYLTVARNFQRVALFGANPGSTRDLALDEESVRKALAASRRDYFNACEYPFWAPDDLLEMTPDGDWWFSGQANYHMHKPTLQRQIRLAHEQGIAMVTYGKWCVSGPAGWEAVYARPWDFNGTYRQPIGSWDAHNAWVFDLRRNGEQVPYSPRPGGSGPWFNVWWNEFVGIGPDPSPALVRTAADETSASVAMFGWDGIRWDGHVRAGWNATGRSGQYQAWAARQTQALVRYFKDAVALKHPEFRHGYNYFLIEKDKGYEWAKEDFELDELARGGGLLMNESIGNASAGWTFAEVARNLQVEGDLCRERGAFYLGISFAGTPRDRLIESALWAAAGCRPYNHAMTREVRRYCTRFAQYTLDERLRRLTVPEKVLAPLAPTRLWWQPFVYETPLENGRRRLVVNLLNLPLQDRRPARDGRDAPVWDMPPGTDPVAFALSLPAGLRAAAVNLIDPQTLAVAPLPLADGRFEVPAVASWSVLTVDLAADARAPSLAALYGPPQTLGVRREDLQERRPEVVLDPAGDVPEATKGMAPLDPEWRVKRQREIAEIEALAPAARDAALERRRASQTLQGLSSNWWKGGVLPDDLRHRDAAVDYGDLTPQRNGRLDIFHGRGAMDHRLRLPEAFGRLDRFAVHDAPFWGSFRGGGLGGMGLGSNVPWPRYPEFDLLLFTGIPYAAIGLENCYGMVPYVKAGGAVLFTGGEWAFGKGGYLMTVLERELLPVRCVEMDDCRTAALPVPMEPGRDFAELGCKADFAAKPSFWVYNRVLLRDAAGIRVFLESPRGPVLVGWGVGRGRVACLLADYRGASGPGVTAFFDWKEWPGLARALFAWLAPEAGRSEPPRARTSAAEAKRLGDALVGDDLGDLDGPDPDRPAAARSGRGGRKGKAGEGDRVATLRKLLAAPPAAIDPTVVLEQLVTAALPDEVGWAALDFVLAHPPANLAERLRAGLGHPDATVRHAALQGLGAVDAPALLRELAGPPRAPEPDAAGRMYALTLAVPLARTPALVEEGRQRVERWNAAEKSVLDAWTGGKGFSPAAPELPGLDAEALFQRAAWLAYLSRHDAAAFGARFAREWLMTDVYREYCGRTMANRKPGDWARLSASFGRLRDLTRPHLDALIATAPDVAAAGFSQAHFTREFRAALNVLGDRDRAATAGLLARLAASAANRDLAAFAHSRL